MNTDLQTDPREDQLPAYLELESAPEVVSEGPVLSQLTPDDEPVRGIDGLHFNPLRTVTNWARTATGITAKVDDSVLTLDVVESDVFRVQILPEWMPEPAASYAVIRDHSTWATEFTLLETESEIRLQTFDARIFIAKSPFRIEAYRPDGSPVLECPADNGLGSYARLNDEFIVTRKRSGTSSVLGLGQKTGSMNRSGRSLILWNTDVLNPRSLKEFAVGFKEGDPRRDPRSREFDPYYISIPFYQSVDEQGKALWGFLSTTYIGPISISVGPARLGFASQVAFTPSISSPALR